MGSWARTAAVAVARECGVPLRRVDAAVRYCGAFYGQTTEGSPLPEAIGVEGLLATLADECVYEMIPTGQRWDGLEGARTFYTELFAAFPDNRLH